MFDEKEIFIEGERRLGLYTVQVLRQTAGGWAPDVMSMGAMVTNHRLLLKPFHRRYSPASLPGTYIKRVQQTTRGRYHCVELQLRTGHLLYLICPGYISNLMEDLRAMKAPPPSFQFDDKIAREHIKRLVAFFSGVSPLATAPEEESP